MSARRGLVQHGGSGDDLRVRAAKVGYRRRAQEGQLARSDETVDTIDSSPPSQREGGPRLALAVAWCNDEPWRVGELVGGLLTRKPVVFGREGEGRVGSFRQRPGGLEPGRPWTSSRLSREQLAISAEGDEVVVQNVGRRELLHEGRTEARVRLAVGEVVELRNQLVLLAVERPRTLNGDAAHPFGEPDEDGIIGETPAIWELRRRIAFVGRRAGHVLVLGPSGTGKELVARALHRHRGRGAWVSRNAATIPEGLVDAELFGNVRNYPNPGMAERPGLIGAADRGTLFLDELGELPEEVQAHLLRVMDDGEYQRLGEARTLRSSARFIAATNRPASALKHDVMARFPFLVEVPALDTRREDIPLIARHLLRSIARQEPDIAARFFVDGEPRVSAALATQLVTRTWTTHVRELLALLWRALAASTGEEIEAVPEDVVITPAAGFEAWVGKPAASIPPEVVQACLDASNGRIETAWRTLGLDSRFVLSRLIKRHGLVVRRTGGD